MAVKRDMRERFDEKWIPVTESGCWLWIGTKGSSGYGQFSTKNKGSEGAHRVGYKLYRGPIPSDRELDHLCRVRCCVNPWHLEIVTAYENMRRSTAWKINPAKTHCPKGHPYSGANLRHDKCGRDCRTCDRERARIYKKATRKPKPPRKHDLPYGVSRTSPNAELYVARIKFRKKFLRIGPFSSPDQAAAAYQEAKKKFQSELEQTGIPLEGR